MTRPGTSAGEDAIIRPCSPQDFVDVLTIINDGAEAYRGVISPDLWHEPYMTREELTSEIGAGVKLWGLEENKALLGVMGIQEVQDVTLIRHAYVRTAARRSGIGGKLLAHLQAQTSRPILIGTWAEASWAIRFYQKHGFQQVPAQTKDALLRQYWNVPARQIEKSIVLRRDGASQ